VDINASKWSGISAVTSYMKQFGTHGDSANTSCNLWLATTAMAAGAFLVSLHQTMLCFLFLDGLEICAAAHPAMGEKAVKTSQKQFHNVRIVARMAVSANCL
jgi:hypothetical protein